MGHRFGRVGVLDRVGPRPPEPIERLLPLSDADRAKVVALYDGGIRYVDDYVGTSSVELTEDKETSYLYSHEEGNQTSFGINFMGGVAAKGDIKVNLTFYSFTLFWN